MSGKSDELSGSKSVPIIIQSEGVFNIGITFNESNYDVWSQLMEMHILGRSSSLKTQCFIKGILRWR